MDGMPLRPVLTSNLASKPTPDGVEIRKVVRSFLTEPISANVMERDEYDAAISGQDGDPNTEQVPQEFCWPPLALADLPPEEEEQSSGGVFPFSFFFLHRKVCCNSGRIGPKICID